MDNFLISACTRLLWHLPLPNASQRNQMCKTAMFAGTKDPPVLHLPAQENRATQMQEATNCPPAVFMHINPLMDHSRIFTNSEVKNGSVC